VDAGHRGHAAEAEALLVEHLAIERAALVGVPDPRLGEVGAAYVVLVSGATLTRGELFDWCEGRLASYKLPAHVRFVESLSVTASGKVKKFELQQAWLGATTPSRRFIN
jgi:fatty-acyl-CoA synthase